MLTELVDWFHEWIDGDHVVVSATVTGIDVTDGVQVVFEDGTTLWITVEDITPDVVCGFDVRCQRPQGHSGDHAYDAPDGEPMVWVPC